MKKVCFYLTTRGNYAKTATVIDALRKDPSVEIQYIVGGDCPQMEFHGTVRSITMIPTGSYQGTYKTAGIIGMEVGVILQELMPDCLVIIADRFECLPVAMIAFYMGIPIAHIEGGEQSASIDDKIRHAITQFATLHFPCTPESGERIKRMRESDENIFVVGATSFDMLRLHKGNKTDAKLPYLVVTYHTANVGISHLDSECHNLLWALSELKMETYWIRPNIDTDSDEINAILNRIVWPFIHVTDSVRIEHYGPLMANAACIVGNSSSGIREASFLGIPVVNVGERQVNRERSRSHNAIDVSCINPQIKAAIKEQIAHGPYPPSYLYGDGHAGEKIAREIIRYCEKEKMADAA